MSFEVALSDTDITNKTNFLEGKGVPINKMSFSLKSCFDNLNI